MLSGGKDSTALALYLRARHPDRSFEYVFCFFQQKGEWVRLRERHPDLFELAKSYEKVEQGYTWARGESLTDLAKTGRHEEILRRERERRERLAVRRRPRNLAQAFSVRDQHYAADNGAAADVGVASRRTLLWGSEYTSQI